MPLIGSFGSGSSRGFGRFGRVRRLPTGGTITTAGGYRIHTFTGSGTFNSGDYTSFNILVVGGGGGFSTSPAGGGGGGGFLDISYPLLVNRDYPIVVGAGGTNGSASYLDDMSTGSAYGRILSDGGGAGGYNANGSDGGYSGYTGYPYGGSSGGGGGGYYGSIRTLPGGAGQSPGFNGGLGAVTMGGGQGYGGGGGGAGGNGANGVFDGVEAVGGSPLYSSITGVSVPYCGGGAGYDYPIAVVSIAGGANTGYGGQSAPGGSGVVIIRYLV